MGKKLVWIIATIIFVVIAAVGLLAYREYHIWTTPWGGEDDVFTVEIEEGRNARQIAQILMDKGVLHNTNMFLVMADLRGLGDKLKAGEYQVKGTQSPYDILDMLATGSQFYRSLVIPEGFNQVEIAQRCAEMEICSATGFLAECRSRDIFQFVIAQPPLEINAALEGILFPDTYYLFKNTPPIKVVDRMTKKFEQISSELVQEARDKSKERGVPWWWESDNASLAVQLHKVVVLASIIEKEAHQSEDRPLVASVFVNRIKKEMPLQSDVTIHYILNDWNRPLTIEDTKINSEYNTYLNPGLPPAAICNPGEESLRAAMMPADSNYLYFIAMNDGDVKFTSSYDEFINWKNQMKQERRIRNASK
ncbi:MAG: endolytic transglycosylase MltG [Candidatus Omnitrophica bacterium]|nr:endolytic transglycosylase MltG [Candidatus Omnitrophota bacterium]